MRLLVFAMVLIFSSCACAYDSSSSFRGISLTATVYGATCSGTDFSAKCFAKPGDRIRLVYSIENTDTLVKDVCLVVKPSRIRIDSTSGLSLDNAYKIYCMGAECDMYSIDKCLKNVPGGSKTISRLEVECPPSPADFGFDTLFYVKTERGRENYKATQSFQCVECVSDGDCSQKKCISNICGGTSTTTTSTTLPPIKYDYDANKTTAEKAQSISDTLIQVFRRLPLAAQLLIAFLILALVAIIVDKIVG